MAEYWWGSQYEETGRTTAIHRQWDTAQLQLPRTALWKQQNTHSPFAHLTSQSQQLLAKYVAEIACYLGILQFNYLVSYKNAAI